MDTITTILTENPVRIGFAVVATAIFYAQFVFLTRISGKRTLAEMTTFDFITNISIGSVLPSAIVTRGIAFWTGIAVSSTLIGLQWLVTTLAVRSRRIEHIISNSPRLLVYNGEVLHANMKLERVTEQQLRGKLREQGYARLSDVGAAVLETSGTVSVLSRTDQQPATLLKGVRTDPARPHLQP